MLISFLIERDISQTNITLLEMDIYIFTSKFKFISTTNNKNGDYSSSTYNKTPIFYDINIDENQM